MDAQQWDRGGNALSGLERLESEPVGVRSHRRSIRSRGPLLALIVPGLLGLVAIALLRNSDTTRRGIGGFVAAVLAAPMLPMLGAPFRSGLSLQVIGAFGSTLIWLSVGFVASRRATRGAFATWGNYWSEYLLLVVTVWVGVLLSIVATNLVLGKAVL